MSVAVRMKARWGARAGRFAVLLTAASMLGGCAASGIGDDIAAMMPASSGPAPEAGAGAAPQSELQKALQYWGKEYASRPADVNAALAYARNLKAAGEKRQALQVLQASSVFHASNRELASEYGRLALEFEQVSLAKRLLEVADDPSRPDWKVVSARGTVAAKTGQYKEAIPLYERALTLQPDHPSLMNNLALAYTMNAEAQKAEDILKRATALGGENAKIRQNLALVLGLQGKYDEATQIGAASAAPEVAAANVALVRKITKAPAKPAPGAAPVTAAAAVAAGAGTGWAATVQEKAELPVTKISAPAKPVAKAAPPVGTSSPLFKGSTE